MRDLLVVAGLIMLFLIVGLFWKIDSEQTNRQERQKVMAKILEIKKEKADKIKQIQKDLDNLALAKTKYVGADTDCSGCIRKCVNSIMASVMDLPGILPEEMMEIESDVKACYNHYKKTIRSFDKLLEAKIPTPTASLIKKAQEVASAQQRLQKSIHKGGILENISVLKDKIGQMDYAIGLSEEALAKWKEARDKYNRHGDYIVLHRLESKFPRRI